MTVLVGNMVDGPAPYTLGCERQFCAEAQVRDRLRFDGVKGADRRKRSVRDIDSSATTTEHGLENTSFVFASLQRRSNVCYDSGVACFPG